MPALGELALGAPESGAWLGNFPPVPEAGRGRIGFFCFQRILKKANLRPVAAEPTAAPGAGRGGAAEAASSPASPPRGSAPARSGHLGQTRPRRLREAGLARSLLSTRQILTPSPQVGPHGGGRAAAPILA